MHNSLIPTLPEPFAPPLLKRRDAARYLGVSLPTLDTLVRQGRLPVVRFGPRLVFLSRSDLDQFIADNRRSA
jgi:excisionase family DNA binding protein